jgi:hypothetical protein
VRTGSPELWALGEPHDVIPAPPNQVVADLLHDWWTLGRRFGCPSARSSRVWYVVCPDPSALCHECAVEVFASERRCALCGRRVRLSRCHDLLFEVGDTLRVLGRAHQHCLNGRSHQ